MRLDRLPPKEACKIMLKEWKRSLKAAAKAGRASATLALQTASIDDSPGRILPPDDSRGRIRPTLSIPDSLLSIPDSLQSGLQSAAPAASIADSLKRAAAASIADSLKRAGQFQPSSSTHGKNQPALGVFTHPAQIANLVQPVPGAAEIEAIFQGGFVTEAILGGGFVEGLGTQSPDISTALPRFPGEELIDIDDSLGSFLSPDAPSTSSIDSQPSDSLGWNERQSGEELTIDQGAFDDSSGSFERSTRELDPISEGAATVYLGSLFSLSRCPA